jgi:hypothetical protein
MSRLDQYYEMIANEGYRPARTSLEGIQFKWQGRRCFLYCPGGDGETFVMLYRLVDIDEGYEDDAYLRAASDVNAAARGIKVWVDLERGSATFAYEAFYLHVDHFIPFLTNLLADIQKTIDDYVERLSAYPNGDESEESEAAIDGYDEAPLETGEADSEDAEPGESADLGLLPDQTANNRSCYCNAADFAILRDIDRGTIPEAALVRSCCWKRICRVRGRNFRAVRPDKWRELCAKRGYVFAQEGSMRALFDGL